MNTVLAEEQNAPASQTGTHSSRNWMLFALGLCLAYGLLLILLIHTTADGSWFWYASAMRSGQHLYRDLHLPLQPMYPIELVLLQRAFGESWIAQQSVGLLNLILFLMSLAALTRKTELVGWQNALLLCCSFITCMAFIMMRFDDFHVVATSIELFCAGLLFGLVRTPSSFRVAVTGPTLGLLCGTCMLLRINDGALLLCTVTFIALCFAGTNQERLRYLLTIPCVALLFMFGVIAAIGESPRDWWFYSIHTAAAIKGGSSHLLLYPLRLPLGTLREFSRDWRTFALTVYACMIGGTAWVLTTRRFTARTRCLLLGVIALPPIPLARNIAHGNAARVLVALAVLGIYASALLIGLRFYAAMRGRPAMTWNPSELILLIPLAQLVSVSLSGARWYPNTNPPAAMMILLLPVALPWAFRRKRVRAVFFSWLALLTLSASIDKVRNPFDWFNYRARSLNAPRVWFQHPAFGPMLVEKQQLELMRPVCSPFDRHSPNRGELLSLPFTYANYFCNVPPWHGYVQTFYDLSGRETIQALEKELLDHPPEWIVYQRQLDVLSRNEEAFNEGRPLPHRELDQTIMAKLNGNQWTAKHLKSPEGDTSSWLLIHTQPGAINR